MFHGLFPYSRTRKRSAAKFLGDPENACPRFTGEGTWLQILLARNREVGEQGSDRGRRLLEYFTVVILEHDSRKIQRTTEYITPEKEM